MVVGSHGVACDPTEVIKVGIGLGQPQTIPTFFLFFVMKMKLPRGGKPGSSRGDPWLSMGRLWTKKNMYACEPNLANQEFAE